MNSNDIVEELYVKGGLRNKELLNKILHSDFVLNWDSSVGLKTMNKNDVLDMADELKANYQDFKINVVDTVSSNNKLVVRYTHQASTIENPSELFTIAKVIVIWDIENGQITKGYQISKPE